MSNSIGRGSDATNTVLALVVAAVCALFLIVALSGPGVIGLLLAAVCAGAAVAALWSVWRSNVDDQAEPDASAAPTDPGAPDGVTSGIAHSLFDSDDDAVSSFVISLARRNGGLVDQQLALLDTLEASVEDPALLADYFKLDHLATRMRRNADNLLVLAGVDRPGIRAPQDIDEVVRAGISEIEDYRRIDVLALEDVQVSGAAATTLGHLVAELLDNATAFSPPATRVRVAGNTLPTGYEILIADSGIGISGTRLDDFNRKLAEPPEAGSKGDGPIGLTVVSMLAARVGATVELAGTELDGTVATIRIPTSALHVGPSPVGEPTRSVPLAEPVPAAAVAAVRIPFAGAPIPPAFPPAPPVPAVSNAVAQPADPSPASQAADAIARLMVTASGLPIRSTSRVADGETDRWPPPAGPLDTALGSLQVAGTDERRPVVAAQPDRIGAALASFARQRVPVWDAPAVPDRTSS